MQVIDAFLFFNELDLLEIRLNELAQVVDKFLIVECTKTFSGKNHELCYAANMQRFKQFHDKIEYVVINDTPDFAPDPARGHNRHLIERWQRAQIDRGLKRCAQDDLIIISDVDEIFHPKNVQHAFKILKDQKKVGFQQRFFYYYLNGLCVQNGQDAPWWGPVACRYRDFPSAQVIRDDRGKNEPHFIDNAGWHFSYLGGVDKIVEKIEAYAHQENDTSYIKDKDRLARRIAAGQDIFDRQGRPHQVYIPIDNSFPRYLQNNINKFEHLIKR